MPKTTLGYVHLAAGILWLAGCEISPAEYHQQGLALYAHSDYIGAKAMFSAALESGREHPDSLYYLGECHRNMARAKADTDEYAAAMRHADRALLYLTQSVEAHPGHWPAARAKSTVLEMKGEYEKALEVAKWSSLHAGATARAYVDWARRLEAHRDFDEAKMRYEQAVSVEPENAWAHAQIGGFFQRLGDRRRAVAAFRMAYRISPLERGVAKALRELGAFPATAVPASSPEYGTVPE